MSCNMVMVQTGLSWPTCCYSNSPVLYITPCTFQATQSEPFSLCLGCYDCPWWETLPTDPPVNEKYPVSTVQVAGLLKFPLR